jgi:hypothetical protein
MAFARGRQHDAAERKLGHISDAHRSLISSIFGWFRGG